MSSSQSPQPPKQSSYIQPDNPISQSPAEINAQRQKDQTQSEQHHRHQQDQHGRRQYGDRVPSITRTAATANLTEATPPSRSPVSTTNQNPSAESELEYGVEQQPSEGKIADAVKGKKTGQIQAQAKAETRLNSHRQQAGAHAGPVGSTPGPGAPPSGQPKTSSNHTSNEAAVRNREAVRVQKLQQNQQVDVGRAAADVGTNIVTKSIFTNMSQLHNALLRPPIIQILRAAGFHSTRPSVLDVLADITSRYMLLLASSTAAHAANAHPDDPGTRLEDVCQALQDAGALRDEDDDMSPDTFLRWLVGSREIRRVAGYLPSEGDMVDPEAMNEKEEDYLTALKKKHSKTGEESRYAGTILGKRAEEHEIVIEGSSS